MDSDVAAVSLERPARTGWLWKQSAWKKQWKKRWFVLWPNAPSREKGRLLFYYITPQDKRPRGVIPLVPGKFTLMTSAARTVKQRDFPVCLVVKLHNKRHESFLLATDNEKEVMSWAHAINAVGSVDADDHNPAAADLVLSTAMLRAQLAPDDSQEERAINRSGDGAAGAGSGASLGGVLSAGDSGEILDLVIQLDGRLRTAC